MNIYGVILLFGVTLCQRTKNNLDETDAKFWYEDGAEELERAINLEKNTKKAKNIILFIGDGMSASTLTAARILKGQRNKKYGEEEKLVFEEFPHVGVIKTYSVDYQVTDSAATATAFLSGVKSNFGALGVTAKSVRDNCSSIQSDSVRVSSIADWAIKDGKDAGVITTSAITGATPAALYANTPDRDWESDGKIDEKNKNCKDIARQLVEDSPGNKLKVILGGGRKNFEPSPYDKSTSSGGRRQDGKNLITEWLKMKKDSGHRAELVTTNQQLRESEADYLLGLFTNEGFPPAWIRNQDPRNTIPSLKEMTRKAISVLEKSKNGYFLLVEEGVIDVAHHYGRALIALEQTLALEEAVAEALTMTNTDDTLIMVTADHSHVMTINGYPKRGQKITGGPSDFSDADNLPYTTLMYTNGPGFNYTIHNNTVTRWNITNTDTHHQDYRALAAVRMNSETHSGDDVLVYATGPGSHLFHGLHEQSYIAHVMSYAAGIGPNQNVKRRAKPVRSHTVTNIGNIISSIPILTIIVTTFQFLP